MPNAGVYFFLSNVSKSQSMLNVNAYFQGNMGLYVHRNHYGLLGTRKLEERKHGALRPQKPLRLIRDGEVGEKETWGFTFTETMTVY